MSTYPMVLFRAFNYITAFGRAKYNICTPQAKHDMISFPSVEFDCVINLENCLLSLLVYTTVDLGVTMNIARLSSVGIPVIRCMLISGIP